MVVGQLSGRTVFKAIVTHLQSTSIVLSPMRKMIVKDRLTLKPKNHLDQCEAFLLLCYNASKSFPQKMVL
jgi:hypothetical protein